MNSRHLLRLASFAMQAALVANGQPQTVSGGLAVDYTLSSTSTTLHEPVIMRVAISDHLGDPASVDLGQDRKQAFEFSITGPDGRIVNARLPLHEGVTRVGVVEIAPGETYTQTLVLDQWYPFSELGTYRIAVRISRPPGSKEENSPGHLNAWATLPPLRVLPLDRSRLVALCEELKTKLDTADTYGDIEEAAVELSYVNDPVAVPYLREMALVKSGVLAGVAAGGLERIDGNSGIEALIGLSRESAPEISSPARSSLWRLAQAAKDPVIKERIREALASR